MLGVDGDEGGVTGLEVGTGNGTDGAGLVDQAAALVLETALTTSVGLDEADSTVLGGEVARWFPAVDVAVGQISANSWSLEVRVDGAGSGEKSN